MRQASPFPRLHAARQRARLLVALLLSTCALPAMAAPDWDIAGLKLGMTEAEVRAAFLAYNPKGKIFAQSLTSSYSDKVSNFRTPPFLSRMELRVTDKAIHIPLYVWFSGTGAGGEPRAIAIVRHEANLANPPAAAQFMQSLVAKYGQPTAADSARTPYWEEPGKPSCIRVTHGIANPFALNLTYKSELSEGVDTLERRQQGSGGGGTPVGMPADLTRCGAHLFYYGTNTDPTNTFTGVMIDVGAVVAATHAREAWVGQLEADALRKRADQGQVPRL